jgi:hypothetical protein
MNKTQVTDEATGMPPFLQYFIFRSSGDVDLKKSTKGQLSERNRTLSRDGAE